jgi:hypothetical protein
MHPLSALACGKPPEDGGIGEILDHLNVTLDRLIVRTIKLREVDDQSDLALFGPVLGRALLEVAFTGILGRLDPFRILLVREFQKQSAYTIDKRSGVAINWQADIYGDKVGDLWKADLHIKNVPRALLGSYYQEVFWREACQNLHDSVPYHRGGGWMSRLRLVEPESFASRMRGETEAIYSSYSKGVHHEFVISPAAYYDKVTIRTLLQRTFELIGIVALTANMCHSLGFRLGTSDAVDAFEAAQEELAAI